VRQSLVERLGAALAGSDLVRAAIGSGRGRKVTEEACVNATLRLADTVVDEPRSRRWSSICAYPVA
jgi:uncharacterized protein (DUF2336 family)